MITIFQILSHILFSFFPTRAIVLPKTPRRRRRCCCLQFIASVEITIKTSPGALFVVDVPFYLTPYSSSKSTQNTSNCAIHNYLNLLIDTFEASSKLGVTMTHIRVVVVK